MPVAQPSIDQNEIRLDALKRADFSWALHLQGVWRDQPYHIAGLHRGIERDFTATVRDLKGTNAASNSPLGWVLTGQGGAGKTHLLSDMRREAIREGCVFILVDMTDVNDFWETVAIGYTSSLQEDFSDGRSQYQFILRELIALISPPEKIEENMRLVVSADPSRLRKHVDKIQRVLFKRYRRDMTPECVDTIRALVATNSEDFEIANLGQMWLQGLELDPNDAASLGFKLSKLRPMQIVSAISRIISLSTPAVLAFDQLDPIVRQLEYEAVASAAREDVAEEAMAKSIISGIGHGLSSIYDVTRRTLTVLSCLESSWDILQKRVLQTAIARYGSVRHLGPLQNNEKFKSIVAARMRPALAAAGLDAPYPTWPFSESALESLSDVTPRDLLKRCEQHRRHCLRSGDVQEVESFESCGTTATEPQPVEELLGLDKSFEEIQRSVDVESILDERNEDETLAKLIPLACECLLGECYFPDDVDAVVDTVFTGGERIKPLHARVRLIFHKEEEREEHYSVRGLQRTNARAYQNRLKLASTQAGIDKALSFRHLVVLRRAPVPGGAVTKQLTEIFQNAGGRFHAPTDDCIRTLEALRLLRRDNDPEFQRWLKLRKPASQTAFCGEALGGILDRFQVAANTTAVDDSLSDQASAHESGQLATAVAGDSQSEPRSKSSHAPEVQRTVPKRPSDERKRQMPELADDRLPLGRKLIGGRLGDAVTIPLSLLNKHAVVLAGAGSGKTVLLKRLVEEAALRGIPSIVLDGANDLAALGDRWPNRPEAWSDEDVELADRYHNQVETVIWTPGKRSGRPLRPELLPDLTSTVGDADEFDAAVAMVTGALAEVLKLGSSRSDQNKQGILSKSLRFYIEQGGTGLTAYIDLLADLPSDAMLGIAREASLAKELADALRVLEETDPMVGDTGDALDPAMLFGDDAPRNNTRVSVINFSFLSTDEAQQRFVNQLATTLFAWIKRNPDPPGRCLRGLLVIDEAKDFVPARRSTPCKESLLRLTAQARKYHLGVVYATQNPREIENTIIGNCSTQYFGKANSPAAIATIRDQLAVRGGGADDVGRLEKGTFYVFNADANMKRPMKVGIPLCLTHHHTLDADDVLTRSKVQRVPDDKPH